MLIASQLRMTMRLPRDFTFGVTISMQVAGIAARGRWTPYDEYPTLPHSSLLW